MTKIITDSTAGLPVAIAQKYDITIIPQIVTFGEQSFYEGVELDNAAFMAKLKASRQLPKTAAPPPELFAREFQRVQPTGEPVLCLHPSSEVSGTVRSAHVAAKDFPGMDIRIIDTRVISSPLATLVTLAAAVDGRGQQHRRGCGAYLRDAALLPGLLPGRYLGVPGKRRAHRRRPGAPGQRVANQAYPHPAGWQSRSI